MFLRHLGGVEYQAKPSRKRSSFGSRLIGMYTGDEGLTTALNPYRKIDGSGRGSVSAGAIHPALPQDAPALTPVFSRTVTSTPRSCRNHAVERPTIPAPMMTTCEG